MSVFQREPHPDRGPRWTVVGVSTVWNDQDPGQDHSHNMDEEDRAQIGSHGSKPWDFGFPSHYHVFGIEDRDGTAWACWDHGLNHDWHELVPWRPTHELLSWLASLAVLPPLVRIGDRLTFGLTEQQRKDPRFKRVKARR